MRTSSWLDNPAVALPFEGDRRHGRPPARDQPGDEPAQRRVGQACQGVGRAAVGAARQEEGLVAAVDRVAAERSGLELDGAGLHCDERGSGGGHHVDALKTRENSRLLRKVVREPIFSEGWGLFTEELMFEQGFLQGDDVRKAVDYLRNASRIFLAAGAREVWIPDVYGTVVRGEADLAGIGPRSRCVRTSRAC